MLNFLPPPQVGEFGCVIEQGRASVYAIHALPLAARREWVALGDGLRALAGRSSWSVWQEYYALAADPETHQRSIQALAAGDRRSRGRERRDLALKLRWLEHAPFELERLRESLQSGSWGARWRKVQHLAQALARSYHAHHVRACEAALRFPYRPSWFACGPAVAEPPPVAYPPPAGDAREALAWARRIGEGASGPVARYRGDVRIFPGATRREALQALFAGVLTLGERTFDTFIALIALYLEQAPADRSRGAFPVEMVALLRLCGIEPGQGKCAEERKGLALDDLAALSRITLFEILAGDAALAGGGPRGSTLVHEGMVLQWAGRRSLADEESGEVLWEQYQFVLGAWISLLRGMDRGQAVALKQLFEVGRAPSCAYIKRLGFYLTFLLRLDAPGPDEEAGPVEVSLGELLDGAGFLLLPGQPPAREQVEEALALLQRERLIGRYARVVEANSWRPGEKRPGRGRPPGDPMPAIAYAVSGLPAGARKDQDVRGTYRKEEKAW